LAHQKHDILINESDIELGWLKSWSAVRADGSDAFPVAPKLPDSYARLIGYGSDVCRRGYIANLRLHADYRLELEHFDFPKPKDFPAQACNQFFDGDFSITFKPFYDGPSTVIPFRSGRIEPDQNHWQIDDQTVEGVVHSIFHKRHAKEPLGLMVDLSFGAFVPRTLVPREFRKDLRSLVGRTVLCTIKLVDDNRAGQVVLQIDRVCD